MAFTTLTALQDQAHRYAEDCYDTNASSTAIGFSEGLNLWFQTGENLFTQPVRVTGHLNDHASRQIADRLDAPPDQWLFDDRHCSDYFRTEILNRLLGFREPQDFFIRSKGTEIRAVLSDQYTKFDNVEFLDMVAQAAESTGVSSRVARHEVGDELSAYVLLPEITFARDPRWPNANGNGPNGNGGLHPCAYVSNSEIGTGSARISGGLFTGICNNGAIFGLRKDKDAFAIRHRFISRTTMGILVAEALAEAFRMSEEGARKFIKSFEVHLQPVSLAPLVNEWAGRYGISTGSSARWLDAVTIETAQQGRRDDPRLFDLFNAATVVAQDTKIWERQAIEEMAGALLFSNVGVRVAERSLIAEE